MERGTERPPDREELTKLAEILEDRFIQRRDLYAKQLDDGSYVSIKKPIQKAHLVAHLRGDLTLGTYLLDESSNGRFMVLDADNEPDWRRLKALSVFLSGEGESGYLERSRRGGHLWLFFKEPLPGSDIRLFGSGLMNYLGIDGVELFPKQDELTSGPGSLIRMPFGVHQQTGQRYGFYKPDDLPLAPTLRKQIKALSAPETLSKKYLDRFRDYLPEKIQERVSEAPGGPQRGELAADATVSDRIKQAITVRQFVLRYVELSKKGSGLCPFHEDHHESFSVNDDENYWHCFACEKGGSVIDFYIELKSCDFTTAISDLSGLLVE